MTLFEYLSIAVSIVLSLVLLRLVAGLRAIAGSPGRDWLPIAWVALLLGVILAHWWTSWSFRGADWTFATFVLMLAGPAILYLAATALVPESTEEIDDWRRHFFKRRVQFFSALSAYAAVSAVDGYLILGAPLVVQARLGQVAVLVLAVLGLSTAKEHLHTFIVVAFALLFIGVMFTLMDVPDSIVGSP